MRVLSFILLLTILSFSSLSRSQTDSSDVNFYSSDALIENEMDSMLYQTGYYELLVEFDIDTLSNIQRIWLDLSVFPGGQLIRHQKFTITQLMNNGVLENGHLKISFGNHPSNSYKISLVIEYENKTLSPTISKCLMP